MGPVGFNPQVQQQRQQQMQNLFTQFGVNADPSSVMSSVRSQLQAAGQQPGQPGQPGAFLNALNNTLVQDGMDPNNVQQFDQAFKQMHRGHHGGHHRHAGGVNPNDPNNPLVQQQQVLANGQLQPPGTGLNVTG